MNTPLCCFGVLGNEIGRFSSLNRRPRQVLIKVWRCTDVLKKITKSYANNKRLKSGESRPARLPRGGPAPRSCNRHQPALQKLHVKPQGNAWEAVIFGVPVVKLHDHTQTPTHMQADTYIVQMSK